MEKMIENISDYTSWVQPIPLWFTLSLLGNNQTDSLARHLDFGVFLPVLLFCHSISPLLDMFLHQYHSTSPIRSCNSTQEDLLLTLTNPFWLFTKIRQNCKTSKSPSKVFFSLRTRSASRILSCPWHHARIHVHNDALSFLCKTTTVKIPSFFLFISRRKMPVASSNHLILSFPLETSKSHEEKDSFLRRGGDKDSTKRWLEPLKVKDFLLHLTLG
jgi:hypothetical protein